MYVTTSLFWMFRSLAISIKDHTATRIQDINLDACLCVLPGINTFLGKGFLS